MKFLLIKPAEKTSEVVEAENEVAALALAGLDPGGVDSGLISRAHGLSIFVYEFGLFEPVEKTHYFSIKTHLYAGNAVVFSFDEAGETIDFDPTSMPEVVFYPDVAAIERAIKNREIERPRMGVNDKELWRWPDAPPAEMRERM